MTTAEAFRLLRQILQAAVDDRLLRANPCRIKGAAVERSGERRIPEVAEVRALAAAMTDRYRLMVRLAGFAGLRRGECFGLRRKDFAVDDERVRLSVGRSIVTTGAGR